MNEEKLRKLTLGLLVVCIIFFALWFNASSDVSSDVSSTNKATYGWISALSFIGFIGVSIYVRYLDNKRLLGNITDNLKGMANATNETQNNSNKDKVLNIFQDAVRLFNNNRYYGNPGYGNPGYAYPGKTARAIDGRSLFRPLTNALGLGPASKSFGVRG